MAILECMQNRRIRSVTIDDEYLSMLSEYVLCSWPSTRADVKKDIQQYWLFRDKIVIIDRIASKGRRIIIPALLQGKGDEPVAHEPHGHRKDKAAGMQIYLLDQHVC